MESTAEIPYHDWVWHDANENYTYFQMTCICYNMKFRLQFFCALILLMCCSVGAQIANTNDWHPNTRLLDMTPTSRDANGEYAETSLSRDVKKFYLALRDKQWHDTYMMRAKAFREDMPESEYLEFARKGEKKWGLVNYEVLSLELDSFQTNDADVAILICKFTELPRKRDTYSTVFWHKEEGVWKCLSAGPRNLIIFDGTRTPIIDWR